MLAIKSNSDTIKLILLMLLFIFTTIATIMLLYLFNILPESFREFFRNLLYNPTATVIMFVISVVTGLTGVIIIFTSRDVYLISVGLALSFFAAVLLTIAVAASINVVMEELRKILESVFSIFRNIIGR